MDKSALLQEIQILEIAHGIVSGNRKLEDLDIAKTSIVNQAFLLYQQYGDTSSLVKDLKEFSHFLGFSDGLYANLRKKIFAAYGESEKTIPVETSSVPATLEGMMAAYEQNKIDRANLESLDTHPIAEAIKRARATQLILQKARIRAERIKQPDENKFFSKVVDPKTNDRTRSEENIRQTSRILVTSILAEQEFEQSNTANQKIIEQLVDQIESGSIKGYDEIRNVSEIFIKDEYPTFKAEYEEVDKLIQEKQKLEEINPDSEKIEELNNRITETSKNILIDPEKYKEKKAKLYNNDLDNFTKKAYSDAEYFQEKLSKTIPHPQIPFSTLNIQSRQIQKFEKLLDSSGILNKQMSGGASRIAGTLDITGGNINPTVVKMIGRGLTEEKLNKFFDDNKNNKEIYNSRNFIYSQFKKIYSSKLKDDILKGTHLESLPKFLNPKAAAENYINKKIGEQVGKRIIKNFGSATAKKFGSYLMESGLQAGSKKFASEVAAKLFAKAGGKAMSAAAASALASASAAAGISTAGLSLILEAAVFLAWQTVSFGYNKFKELYKNTFGEEFSLKETAKGVAFGAAVIGGTIFALKKGAKFFGVATKAAAISAVGVIVLSIATIAVFLTFTFLTAPILSTLVQLDSTKKVKYEELIITEPIKPTLCTNMTWPVKESCRITQGPKGQYSHSSPDYSESVDIACPSGTDVYSTTDGTVDFVGNSGPYLNTDIIIIKSTLANGTSFQVVYAHMSSIEVHKDQTVNVGQKLGLSGTAGSGAHLHYEYKGIEYNECPAGDLQLAERCDSSHVPGPNRSCIQELDLGSYLYSN